MAQQIQINLVLEEGADKNRVKTEAEAVGFSVEQELDALGLITGSGPGDILNQLKAIPGVSAVERGREVRIPRSDSPVQ